MPAWNQGAATVRAPISADWRIAALQNATKFSEHWDPSQPVTFSFASPTSSRFLNGQAYGSGELASEWRGLTPVQQESVRQALAQWSAVADIRFEEVRESDAQVGTLRFAFTSGLREGMAAHAYYPRNDSAKAGDVWLGWARRDASLSPPDEPQLAKDYVFADRFSFAMLVHEIGHTLGLAHPFEQPQAMRRTAALQASEDDVLNTLMSYNWNVGDLGLAPPTTPMPYDILAIQYLYGANQNHKAGDTVWRFDIASASLQTIWDAGGIDTLRAVDSTKTSLPNLQHAQWSMIDLQEGAGSRIGFINDADFGKSPWTPSQPLGANEAPANIYLAFGTVIENAIGSPGPDVIYGNAHNNRLDGGGDQRQDQLDGREGRDTAVYAAMRADYTVAAAQPTFALPGQPISDIGARKDYTVTRIGTDARQSQDWLVDIERLEFKDLNVALDLKAGQAATHAVGLVTALWGREALSNTALVGEVIHFADRLSIDAMAQLAVDMGITTQLAGADGDVALVALMYANIVGEPGSQEELGETLDYVRSHNYTTAQALSVAATLPQTLARADLVGLQQQGLSYLDFG